jgi:hypothetical protein
VAINRKSDGKTAIDTAIVRSQLDDMTGIPVVDDLPATVPIRVDELAVIEQFLLPLLDQLFAPTSTPCPCPPRNKR